MNTTEYLGKISREPLPEMIKEVKDKAGELEYKFIPKSVLQSELLKIYEGNDQWEMIRDTVNKDGMWGTGVLKVKHPVTGDWISKTGTASLRHEKNMKLNYPNLEAQCFKNACKKIGVWFGQTLNLDIDDFEPEAYNIEPKVESEHSIQKEWEVLKEKLDKIDNKEDAMALLKTTDFKNYVPASKLVNSKPSKIK